MSKDPAVLFYTSDFLTGTSFFTYEQRGQYITLLCQQHQLGSIPENHMISICGSINSPVISKFIRGDKGNYYNDRMRIEAEKRKRFCESRSNNKSGRKKNNNNSESNDNHMIIHMENENDNGNDIKSEGEIGFNLFWNAYDKKISKDKCEKKWNKLSGKDQIAAMQYILEYKRAQPDKKYRKNPDTFLNQKSWNDEIIHSNGKENEFADKSRKSGVSEDYKNSILNRLLNPIGPEEVQEN